MTYIGAFFVFSIISQLQREKRYQVAIAALRQSARVQRAFSFVRGFGPEQCLDALRGAGQAASVSGIASFPQATLKGNTSQVVLLL
jgi:hypothetical protein